MIISKEVESCDGTTYPVLKESPDYVVLFVSKSTGVVVEVKNPHAPQGVGYMPDFWAEDHFTVFKESVVLSNG